VPGGIANGMRQMYSGAPQFGRGDQYVLFLWTGNRAGRRLWGFRQGAFAVAQDGFRSSLTRSASHELMLDAATHGQVTDRPLTMRLSELRSQVASALGAAQ